MSAPPGVVVVGASIGGVRAVQALRQDGYAGPIQLLSEEDDLPYDKPPLSKGFLTGEKSEDDITLLSAQEAADLGVELVLGARAVALHPASREVELADGQRLAYDAVILATGARARDTPWLEFDGVHVVRSLEDGRRLRADLHRSSNLAVIGAGFVGAEVAASARTLGLRVTVVDPMPYPMARVLGGALADRIEGLHRGHKVDLRLGTGVESLEQQADGLSLVLTDGSVITADTVVLGIGSQPNCEWLVTSGLVVDDGVVCDAVGRAQGAVDVYAIGDVARWHGPHGHGPHRHEHWTNAVEQAAVVSRMITKGESAEHESTGYVWSDQFNWAIQVVGDPTSADGVEIVEAPPAGGAENPRPRLAAVYADAHGMLVGGVVVSWPKAMVTLRRGLAVDADAASVRETLEAMAAKPAPVQP